MLLGLNSLDHALRFHLDLSLLQRNLLDIAIVSELEQLLHVVPAQLQELFLLIVLDTQQFKLFVFHLLLQMHIVVGGS